MNPKTLHLFKKNKKKEAGSFFCQPLENLVCIFFIRGKLPQPGKHLHKLHNRYTNPGQSHKYHLPKLRQPDIHQYMFRRQCSPQ